MSRKKTDTDETGIPKKLTDIEAARWNVEQAVGMFVERWMSLPEFAIPCEVVDQGQLRDLMGLRATIDIGDSWPTAEQLLLNNGFRWHWMGSSRVMFLRERNDAVSADYDEAEEVT